MRLSGQTAVVTGGASGIGRSITRRFAEEGATVVVGDRRLEPARETVADIEADDGRAIAVEADVADADDVDRLIEQTVVKFDQVDTLVNNAGTGSSSRSPRSQRTSGTTSST